MTSKWTDINSPLGSNAVFDIETRVGVTLFNLTHKGSYEVAGSIFGTGKTQAIAHEDQLTGCGRIMCFSIRSGSQNDMAVFNNSKFGKICHDAIPVGCYYLGDAGYTLLLHAKTPFKIYYGIPRDEARYNYLNIKMRIIVEGAKTMASCLDIDLANKLVAIVG
ncbi:hypothetical protein GN244_ATG13223 [Phytophthora infestans]|uniref:DDE Tnp4 domain-containing protein n=1 Tax=Phytophthora infestans TaxID=4787 RepID=A0A833S6T9_PHYIN|nr:hypothetical protein GN244_ATG13223 [Phytophthora infestans]